MINTNKGRRQKKIPDRSESRNSESVERSEELPDISSTFQTVNRSEFRTPDLNGTDYGLEFTTSRLESPSPKRHLTVRSPQHLVLQQAHQEEETPHVKQTKLPKKQTGGKNDPVRKCRKLRNPVRLEQRFQGEVRALQNLSKNLIPFLPFSRLTRKIMINVSKEVTKITATALEALQTSTEMYVTQILEDAYLLTLHRGQVTLKAKDMELIKFLK